MKSMLTKLAVLVITCPLIASPAFAHKRHKSYGVPEIDVAQGAAAIAIVVATLFLLRELWIRRKRVQA